MTSFADTIITSKSKPEAMKMCQDALLVLPRLKLPIRIGESVVSAKTRWSFLSYGEQVVCTITPTSEGTAIAVKSELTMHLTAFDYGINQKNVAAVIDRIRQLNGSHPQNSQT
ncbi:hypothetical protein [Catenuloplanes atrovinosus]|uniref:DUF1499 domain-containing protein n=1 Tax=Catenuloplanes atrovinosus TaxID=137266 RepID=A0AAE3YVF3_9ACTN|nr:hypothetical protein [Catenuloplanes atrovinosus]MDR7280624.1 hypothetical protein [Catenuloplanes atrovinosus]